MKAPLNLVVVEDDPSYLAAVLAAFGAHHGKGFVDTNSLCAYSPAPEDFPDLILLDLCSPSDPEGTFSLKKIPDLRRAYPEAELWVQSGIGDIARMKSAIHAGAQRFVAKETLLAEAPMLAEQLGEVARFKRECAKVLQGNSTLVAGIRESIARLKFSPASDVLIEGETGTGKELCARLLAGEGAWVAVNCSAVPAELFEAEFFGAEKGAFTGSTQTRTGYFESAGEGTLFLDEIQALPLPMQAKLLRAIETRTYMRVGSTQERPFRARILSACNVRLDERVAKGEFREDLYYRLAVLKLILPPLRARKADILPLFESFLKAESQGRVTLQSGAGAWLESGYDWPGNIRELRGLAKRLGALARLPLVDEEILREHLDVETTPTAAGTPVSGDHFVIDWTQGFDANLARLEKLLLQRAMALPKSTQARDFLKIGRSRYYEKLREHGLGA